MTLPLYNVAGCGHYTTLLGEGSYLPSSYENFSEFLKGFYLGARAFGPHPDIGGWELAHPTRPQQVVDEVDLQARGANS
jgi:hypothetical protein